MNLQGFSTILQEQCQISPADQLLVGVSGGADSVALLHMLKQSGYTVVAYHFNHQIRPESSKDAEFVASICKEWGIICDTGLGNVPDFAEQNKIGIEEAARILRYKSLLSAAEKYSCNAVAVAHHADDQIETILMHFIRGAGLDGLRGMPPRLIIPAYSQSIPVIRPLLPFSKAEILNYCNENGLPYREDSTNQDKKYFRNWLRLDLIPRIETFNPKFGSGILRASVTIKNDLELLEELVDKCWELLQVFHGTGYLGFSHKHFINLTDGLRHRVIRRVIQILDPQVRDFDFLTAKRVSQWICQEQPVGQIDLIGGCIARFYHGKVYFLMPGVSIPITDFPQLLEPIDLTFPGEVNLDTDWLASAEVLDMNSITIDLVLHAPKWEAWMDIDQIHGKPYLDWKKPGDRFTPLGWMEHSARVSDIWLNHKIPAAARERYPILRDEEDIIWLPGITIAQRVRVTENTKRILRIRLIKKKLYYNAT